MSDCTIRGCRNLNTICADCGRTVITRTVPPLMMWIDVKERLPEKGSRVLAYGIAQCGTCDDSPMIRECRYNCRREYFEFGEYDCPLDATHWMNLPDAPGKKRHAIGDILEEYEFNGEKIKK